MGCGPEILPAALEVADSRGHVTPVIGRDIRFVHLIEQVHEIVECSDRRSGSMLDQRHVFARHAQGDRTLDTFQENTAVMPASRQSRVGGGEGTGDTTVAQKDSPYSRDVRLGI